MRWGPGDTWPSQSSRFVSSDAEEPVNYDAFKFFQCAIIIIQYKSDKKYRCLELESNLEYLVNLPHFIDVNCGLRRLYSRPPVAKLRAEPKEGEITKEVFH